MSAIEITVRGSAEAFHPSARALVGGTVAGEGPGRADVHHAALSSEATFVDVDRAAAWIDGVAPLPVAATIEARLPAA